MDDKIAVMARGESEGGSWEAREREVDGQDSVIRS